MSQPDTTYAIENEDASRILTKWTPLRRLVDEHGLSAVVAELAEIANELGNSSVWDFCPECKAPTAMKPDNEQSLSLHCTECDWVVPITVTEKSAA